MKEWKRVEGWGNGRARARGKLPKRHGGRKRFPAACRKNRLTLRAGAAIVPVLPCSTTPTHATSTSRPARPNVSPPSSATCFPVRRRCSSPTRTRGPRPANALPPPSARPASRSANRSSSRRLPARDRASWTKPAARSKRRLRAPSRWPSAPARSTTCASARRSSWGGNTSASRPRRPSTASPRSARRSWTRPVSRSRANARRRSRFSPSRTSSPPRPRSSRAPATAICSAR